jgi:hypothetical protein
MINHIRLITFALLLTVASGCFPVFVPAGDGHHDGRGRGGEHEHRDRH